jgi:hypothetical protein
MRSNRTDIPRPHLVKLSFTTKDGVAIIRTVTLTDRSRANAEHRAKAIALPKGAQNVAVLA